MLNKYIMAKGKLTPPPPPGDGGETGNRKLPEDPKTDHPRVDQEEENENEEDN